MPSQIILISDKVSEVEKVENFSRKNKWLFSVYTSEEWDSRSDEAFLFHNEEFSQKALSLPSGYRPIFSLDEIEAYIIEKILGICNGNTSKAARLLRIGRATLYRKIEKLGIELEHLKVLREREKERERERKNPIYLQRTVKKKQKTFSNHQMNGKMPLKKAI